MMRKHNGDKTYTYLVFNRDIHSGKRPIIKGTRITIDDVLDYIASGWSTNEISRELVIPKPAVLEVLRFASQLVKEVVVIA